MIGYDIDGVLAAGVKPEGRYIVVSGRTMDEWERTVAQLGPAAPIYLRPFGKHGDQQAAAHWKATVIAACGVTVFYEDEPGQAAIIRERCPWCDVRMVTNGVLA